MKTLKFFSGFIMFLIGFLVLLQASDLNPLLTIKNYGVWVNGHFPLGTNFF